MPRLVHRPPKYCLHKATKQACVSLGGKRVWLGPYGSARSHRKYQVLIAEWRKRTHAESRAARANAAPDTVEAVAVKSPWEKRRAGVRLTINELALVYRRHTHQYYRKEGVVTREASIIDDALRQLRKYHAYTALDDFGPVALEELRD